LPEEVFRLFSRLESSRTAPGTGLGLPIVQAVARLHRAELLLDDPRAGLAVSLRFPGVDGPNKADGRRVDLGSGGDHAPV
jgi:signal transduction histidine kinase